MNIKIIQHQDSIKVNTSIHTEPQDQSMFSDGSKSLLKSVTHGQPYQVLVAFMFVDEVSYEPYEVPLQSECWMVGVGLTSLGNFTNLAEHIVSLLANDMHGLQRTWERGS